MLEGRKPLAVFGGGYPSDWFDEFLAPFEPFVTSRQIIRRIIDTPMAHLKERRPDLEGIRDVYFALPGEEWRIDAYIDKIRNRTRDWEMSWSVSKAHCLATRIGKMTGGSSNA
ncbi:hypothetical protein [Novosphingobium rosa]|uniref:hypothetical protein n=1 Tax=Novosphingobium rosa TaxID=76978 RepID=UPI000A5998FD|nr:hypothetical protein [Novosphingobium rosa]